MPLIDTFDVGELATTVIDQAHTIRVMNVELSRLERENVQLRELAERLAPKPDDTVPVDPVEVAVAAAGKRNGSAKA